MDERFVDQVNGCRQRFLTKFLHVRLVELKNTVEERLEKLDAEAIEVEVRTQDNTPRRIKSETMNDWSGVYPVCSVPAL